MMPTVRPPPPKELWGRLAEYGTATISSALREECGVTRAYAFGPACVVPGQRLVGLAKTISFLPKREDIIQGLAEEENEKESPLWCAPPPPPANPLAAAAHPPARGRRSGVMETGEDEVLVVDCRGNMQTGCLGGMLMTALATNGAAGLVVDGCVRDLPEAIGLADELPVFVRGGTPHNAGHYEMYPVK